jgi:putative aldouronate transport system permease protein
LASKNTLVRQSNHGPKHLGSKLRRVAGSLPLNLMALPGLLVLLVFSYFPMAGIILAFKDYDFSLGVFGSEWVGFENFEYFFTSGVAWRLIRNTVGLNLLFMITVQVAAIIVALLLNEIFDKRIAKVYQSVIFFPHFISWVIVGYFAYAFLNADQGLVNNILFAFGQEKINWYSEAGYWPTILNFISCWKGLGYFSIIYLAGMVTINPEYYESLRIDGGNKWKEMWYITIPFIKPLIYINVFLTIGRVFYANFDFFLNVTRNTGQIMSTTDVIDTFVVRTLTVSGDFNMAAAAGLFQGVCGFVLILLANWIVSRLDNENTLF